MDYKITNRIEFLRDTACLAISELVDMPDRLAALEALRKVRDTLGKSTDSVKAGISQMKDVEIIEMEQGDSRVTIFKYKGSGDPVKYLNAAVSSYASGVRHKDFIDASMSDPWVRVVVVGPILD